MKKIIPLNQDWLYKGDFVSAYLDSSVSLEGFSDVTLPHNGVEMDADYFDADSQQCVVTYAKVLNLDESYDGSKVVLSFEGVLSYSEVYVNGVFVSSHKGDTAFDLDITAPIKFNYDNIIIVKADSTIRKDVPTSGFGNPVINYSGIHRDVYLQIINGEVIDDIHVKVLNVEQEEKSLEIDIKLNDFYPETTLSCEIISESGAVVGKLNPKSVLSNSTTLRGVVSGVTLWSTENPALYTARVVLTKAGKVLDTHSLPFGFRVVKFKRSGFYLNGIKTKLIGLNRIDAYSIQGKGVSASRHIMDAKIIKNELGCNVVRTIGYPSRDFIKECDTLGLLVIPDLSGDGYLGDATWRDSLLNNISEIVHRDKNSPSVICWGIRPANCPDCDELFFKANALIKSKDTTRQTLGSRGFMASRLYEEIFGYNDYPLNNKEPISKMGATSKLFVPYIITEHTGKSFPTKMHDNRERRLEQALRHLRVIDSVINSNNICGAIGMSLADFHAGNGKGSNNGINHYGVMDIDRNPKLSYYAYASQFSKNTVLVASDDMCGDESADNVTIFTNCDYIKLFRNNKEVGDFYPNKKKYKNLPHPPIEIDDLLGGIPESEGLSPRQSKLFKKLSKSIRKNGILNLPLVDKLVMFYLRQVKKMTTVQFREYLEEFSLKPLKPVTYNIAGYKNEKVVDNITLGGYSIKGYNVSTSSDKIVYNKSMQDVRITVTATDENQNRRWYDFSPIWVEVSANLEIIGKNNFSLNGGIASFYVKGKKHQSDTTGTIKVFKGENVLSEIKMEIYYETMERI